MKKLHSLPLRAWHWVNTVLVILLMLTGLSLRVPDLHILDYRSAVFVHKATGYVVAAGFLFWLVLTIADGSLRRYYVVRRRNLSGLPRQARYYAFGIFKGEANPHPATAGEKFNPLQKFAYLSIQFLIKPVLIVTGVLFSNILFFHREIAFIGGIKVLDAVHLAVAYIFVDYLLVHMYMATVGKTPLSSIKEMFTGRAEAPDKSMQVRDEGR
jgi:thiosulfate reductase cytochrome b subunit